MRKKRTGLPRSLAALTAVMAALACEPVELVLPTAEEVTGYYEYGGRLTAALDGNVAEVTIVQSAAQLRRGGALWAKVGPYVLLFSDGTRRLLVDYNGLAGVRVITKSTGGAQVAEAFLARGTLNELTWRRALNIAGIARRDGSEKPSRLEDLVRWGEDHTEFEYNPRYIGR